MLPSAWSEQPREARGYVKLREGVRRLPSPHARLLKLLPSSTGRYCASMASASEGPWLCGWSGRGSRLAPSQCFGMEIGYRAAGRG